MCYFFRGDTACWTITALERPDDETPVVEMSFTTPPSGTEDGDHCNAGGTMYIYDGECKSQLYNFVLTAVVVAVD